LALSLHSQGMV